MPLTMALNTVPNDPIPSSPAVNPLVAALNSENEKWRMLGRTMSELADEDDVIPVDVKLSDEGVKREWFEDDEFSLVEFCEEGVNCLSA